MLIPRPVSISDSAGSFALTPATAIHAPDAPEVAALLRELLTPVTGLPLPDTGTPGPDTIALRVTPDATDLGTEGYRLEVSRSGVTAAAPGAAGLRWAVQTLRQLLPVEAYAPDRRDVPWTVTGVSIVDTPRYPWRGLLVDVGRWHKPVSWLRRVVDLLAMHRMNVLHLHLTEDQGWRFEVRKHPRLTEVGAFRRASPRGHETENRSDDTPHGGFYTQDELRDLVAYAARRGVTIVPEIDLPGHMQAAIAAYPHLGNAPDDPPEVWTRFGVSDRVLNVEDGTVAFVRDVLDELMDVFPGPWIHLGGDEVPLTEWESSPAAARRIAAEGLTGPADLLGWWIRQAAAHVTRAGRRPVLWDELVGQHAPADAVVMAWRGHDRIAEGLLDGHDVIATPHEHLYLNYPASDAASEPLSIRDGYAAAHGPTTLDHVYAYRPQPAGLPSDLPTRVVGVQANMWCEYAPTPDRAEYDLLPRLSAVAEVAWGTPDSLPAFHTRLSTHLRRLDAAGYRYRPLDGPGLTP
ncbi:beta-N-acetylhexosaminidase [Catenuloplanes atrovinosus]|uniref:beta-N-acetylhexosaminidase n=1 Tax=Catenuloplanes atrovinosus TaxID=137266 RepID=A0AAE3YVL2_9ACTN|nr:beta-N-acetylhexosaminidase [Catenuloplanes atrovinosus]MDR7279198.1 hexosaminidase [Catenuloplanes atrovinosus]